MKGDRAERFRERSAIELCRLLGGDETLIEEIRARQQNLAPEVHEFFLRPIKLLQYQKLRQEARIGAKRKAEAKAKQEAEDEGKKSLIELPGANGSDKPKILL